MTPALEALRHITSGIITTVPLKDGVVVIPQNLLDFVAHEGTEHAWMETYIVSEVEKGAALPGLYPMNEQTKARFSCAPSGFA